MSQPGSTALSIAAEAHEQSIALTRDFRLLQKRRGHRYSVDDMLVAHLAVSYLEQHKISPPEAVLDLGCGLGSVLLIMAWSWPTCRFVGLEALAEHVHYARRNLVLNHCENRAEILHGDLREAEETDKLGRFALVTGSPPYFAINSGTLCADPARAAAHFELRGGIEDYALAAKKCLKPDGLFVCCSTADPPERSEAAFAQAGLEILYQRDVIPREGKAPFLQLLVATTKKNALAQGAQNPQQQAPLILRQADGERTAEHRAIRAWTGL